MRYKIATLALIALVLVFALDASGRRLKKAVAHAQEDDGQ